MSQTVDFLEKLAIIFLYNFHYKQYAKIEKKKLSPEINVKDIKNRVKMLKCLPGPSPVCVSLGSSDPWLFAYALSAKTS